jgi:hypothetical protein
MAYCRVSTHCHAERVSRSRSERRGSRSALPASRYCDNRRVLRLRGCFGSRNIHCALRMTFFFKSSLTPPRIPELDNSPPIPFRRPTLRRRRKIHHRLTLCRDFQSQLAALVRLTVQCLRHHCRPPYFAEQQNFHSKIPAFVPNLYEISNPNFACRLSWLIVGLNSTEIARPRRQSTRLKKPGSPKPLVHSHTGHDLS